MQRSEIATVLASAGLRPRHKFGQNFMVDQQALLAIVEAGEIEPGDVILEVGPGVGNLTRLLAQRAGAVLAVDIDRKLLPAAQRHLAELCNITWLNADVLAGKHAVNPLVLAHLGRLRTAHPLGCLKLVSNLPYNAASPLIAELLVEMWVQSRTVDSRGQGRPPALAFHSLSFTVQLEVALRMNAAIDTTDYGPLGILIQLLADVEILRKIPPGCFWPPPKVHSALVRVTPRPERFGQIPDVLALQRLLSGLFSHRRQTVGNGLKHYLGKSLPATLFPALAGAQINIALRPEQLPAAAFVEISRLLRD